MKTAEIIETDGVQAVKLPEEFRLPGKWVRVKRQGTTIVLAPVAASAWPADFLEALWNNDEEASAEREMASAGRAPLD